MNLSNKFEKTWQGVEVACRRGQVQNQSALAYTFCRTLGTALHNLHIIYDGRLLPDVCSRPNMVIWEEGIQSTVVFMGIVSFSPEGITAARQDTKALRTHINKPKAEVLADHRRTTNMKVSSNVEFGYFTVGDINREIIYGKTMFNLLSPSELERFHLAQGCFNDVTDFNYQKPQSMGK